MDDLTQAVQHFDAAVTAGFEMVAQELIIAAEMLTPLKSVGQCLQVPPSA